MSPDVEKIRCPTDDPLPPPYPKHTKLARAVEIVIRPVSAEGILDILRYAKPLVFVERDYCDLVAARPWKEPKIIRPRQPEQ
jgi:hypothetical protein